MNKLIPSSLMTLAALIVGGCQEPTKPASGYFYTQRDRGQNIDSDSPSVPDTSGQVPGRPTGLGPDGSTPRSTEEMLQGSPATQPR